MSQSYPTPESAGGEPPFSPSPTPNSQPPAPGPDSGQRAAPDEPAGGTQPVRAAAQPDAGATRPVPTTGPAAQPEDDATRPVLPAAPGDDATRPVLAAGADDATRPVLAGSTPEPAPGPAPDSPAAPDRRQASGDAPPASADEPAAGAGDLGDTGPVTISQTDRHPTGAPEQTGGWYGAAQDQTQPVPPAPKVTNRHPTGDPQRTGGWYTPDDAATRVTGGRTRPSAAGAPDRDRTIPSAPGGPLPRPVEEVDRYATRVNPAAYGAGARRGARPAAPPPPPPPTPPAQRASHTQQTRVTRTGWQRSMGCLLRLVIGLIFLVILVGVAGASFAVYQYYSIAAGLPSIDDLQQRASQFETTRILDREGNTLYEMLDPNAGRRTYVPLEKMSPYLIAATIATEDKDYYTHPGFDPVAIARAFWGNYTAGEITSGASTITQQLARMLLLSYEERNERTFERKTRELVLAAEITRKYSKEEILELYLNEIYYGNLAYGAQAAAETYFNTTAEQLTLSQAAFLAGLPQAPGVYDIFNNRDETLRRHKAVLVLMYELSQERDCIYVSTNLQKVCVEANTAADAAIEMEGYEFQQSNGQYRYPHWVNYIRAQLEAMYDAQTIYRSGFTVTTTLDPALQDLAEQTVRDQVSTLADRNVSSGALVAIRPNTGEILAMVGSADFNNEAISGQVNMAVEPRQPGSAMKPLTYAAAFERGWTPATLIWDVPTEFSPSGDPNDPRPPYVPVNYDERFHGPVTVRSALANSYNIPAVKALSFIGIYDNPSVPGQEGLVPYAQRLGITTLTRNDYGLALTLGGGDVSLLELTGAFGVYANDGRRVPPVSITRITDFNGNVVFEYKPPAGDQVVRPEHAFLLTSILSDNEARAPMFGSDSVLALPFPAAAKTGTTNDFRDNWTVGYTPDLVTGVWVGNADYTPMQNTTGLTGAAPIWSQFMQAAVPAITGGAPRPFNRPEGIVERVVCTVSGAEPSEWCPDQRVELFAADQPPLPADRDLWQRAKVDTWTGLSASPACPDFIAEKFAINTYGDPSAEKWIRDTEQGRAWAESVGFQPPLFVAPDRPCTPEDPRADLKFTNLSEGQVISSSPLDIFAVINGGVDHRRWRLEYGLGDDPAEWLPLIPESTVVLTQPDKIHTWDLKDLPAGRITLRLYLESTEETYAERRIHLDLQVPTPTPTMTPTATATPPPTATSTPAPTATTPAPTPTLAPIGPIITPPTAAP